MLKKIACVFAITFAGFAIVIPQEAFADANNQRWNYYTTYGVCPDGTILYVSESRSLETWTDGNHPARSRYWGQVCHPYDLKEPDGPAYCYMDWIYQHTSHSVYWHSATYQTATRQTDSPACR